MTNSGFTTLAYYTAPRHRPTDLRHSVVRERRTIVAEHDADAGSLADEIIARSLDLHIGNRAAVGQPRLNLNDPVNYNYSIFGRCKTAAADQDLAALAHEFGVPFRRFQPHPVTSGGDRRQLAQPA